MSLNNTELLLCLIILILFHERVISDNALMDHIRFSYECLDRVTTRCLAEKLRFEAVMAQYLHEECGGITKEILKARTARIHEQMEKKASANGLKIVILKGTKGMIDKAHEECKKRLPTDPKQRQLPLEEQDHIIAIFKHISHNTRWSIASKTGKLCRSGARTYHYTVYHFDTDFGIGCHTLNTYLPHTVLGYFNQHNWLLQQLKKHGKLDERVRMHRNSFQDLGSIDPEWFQKLCDSLIYWDIYDHDRKWIKLLWPELANLDYVTYLNEVEYSSNIVFKQAAFLNTLYHNHLISNFELGQPHKLTLLFERRIDRRYKNPFKTQLSIVKTKPCLKVKYKKQQLKEYLKGRVLRIESTTNNPQDLGLKKRDLSGIRKKSREINQRVISINQPVNPKWIRQNLDHDPLDRVKVGEKWIPGLRIKDEKMATVMKGLLKSNIIGISMRDLTDFVNQDLGRLPGEEVTLAQVSYAVRKLRGHGLTVKVDDKNQYHLTPIGHCYIRMFLQVTEKIFFPATKNIMDLNQKPRTSRKKYQPANRKSDFLKKLNGIYTSIDKAFNDLFDILDIAIVSEIST